MKHHCEDETNIFVVVDTEDIEKEQKGWYEFKLTIILIKFMLYAEYWRFFDKQKRNVKISFETITSKNNIYCLNRKLSLKLVRWEALKRSMFLFSLLTVQDNIKRIVGLVQKVARSTSITE